MIILTKALEDNWSLENIRNDKDISIFTDLFEKMQDDYKATMDAEISVKKVVGQTFVNGLEHAGVYKLDEAGRLGVLRFIEELNQ